MEPTALLLAALLALYHPPADVLARIEAHRAAIEADAAAAAAHYGVPAGILLAVGFAESHLGQARASGGSWGSPTDRAHRLRAGRAEHTARDIAASFRVCGNWPAAVRRFRSGLCFREPPRGYTSRTVLRIAARIYDHAHVPLPDGLAPARATLRP